MDGDKPEVGHAGAQHGVHAILALEPVEKCGHLLRQPFGDWSFEVDVLTMDPVATNRTGHDLHWVEFRSPPLTDKNAPHAAAPGGEKRRLPSAQAIRGQRCSVILRGIEHHLDHAFDVMASRCVAPKVKAKTAGNR